MTKPQLRRDNNLRKLKAKVLNCPEDVSKEKDQSWTSQRSIRTGKKTVDEIRTPKIVLKGSALEDFMNELKTVLQVAKRKEELNSGEKSIEVDVDKPYMPIIFY